MRKNWFVLFVVMAFIALGSVAFAAEVNPDNDPTFPKLVGNDVHYNAIKLQRTTPGWKPGDTFYIAIEENAWDPQAGDKAFEMEAKGDLLIARNVINQRHHPVLVSPRRWQQIERAYPQYLPKKGEFKNHIDYTNPAGPGYCFGPLCVPFDQGGR